MNAIAIDKMLRRIKMADITVLLSEFVHRLSFNSLPQHTVENTRLFLIDYFAAAIAGKRVNTTFNAAIESAVFAAGGTEEATVLFSSKRLPVAKAAFMGAVYAHGADMDDGNRKAMGHVGACVFSTVLALAEKLGKGEQDIIVAANAGYELYCRIAAAAQPGLVHRGFHSTGTAGVIAAAGAAAKLMGLTAAQIRNAMAISVTMASGLMIIAEPGQSIKPLNPARAAEGGILAAFLAAKGVSGGDMPLESEKGWLHAMTDKADMSMITNGLGSVFCIDECYIKPYPSCRHTHPALQAAQDIMFSNGLKATDIEGVTVHIYENAIKIAGQITAPQNNDDKKFSIHYALACMLAHGDFGLADIENSGVAPEVKALTEKIKLISDSTMENRDKGIRGCRVVITAHGTDYSETVLIPKGDPQNPFTVEDERKKLLSVLGGVVKEEKALELYADILSFGKTNSVYKGWSLL